MTKRDILSFIDAKKKISSYNKFNGVLNNKLFTMNSNFSLYKEISNEIQILRKEIDEAFKASEISNEVVNQLKSKCNHEVRLNHYSLFGCSSKCVFCDKFIGDDSYCNWEDSINRNRHSVTFESNVRCDDDGYEYEVDSGYNLDQVYDLIINMIKDISMDDEVDLVKLFENLNLKDCLVRNEEFSREDYILIVSGSNKEYLDEDIFVSRNYNKTAVKVLDYFKDMLGVKVCFVGSEKISKSSSVLKVISYDSLESLDEVLDSIKDIPFKCIFDFSSLFKVSYENRLLFMENYAVDFKELFSESLIVTNGMNCYFIGDSKLVDSSIDDVCVRVRKLISSK